MMKSMKHLIHNGKCPFCNKLMWFWQKDDAFLWFENKAGFGSIGHKNCVVLSIQERRVAPIDYYFEPKKSFERYDKLTLD